MVSNPSTARPHHHRTHRATHTHPTTTGLPAHGPLPPSTGLVQWHEAAVRNKDVLILRHDEFHRLTQSHAETRHLSIDEVTEKTHDIAGHTAEIQLAIKSLLSNTFREVALERVTIKIYKGERYVILKGRAGLRNILKGTRYKAENPKLVDLAIGEVNVLQKVKSDVKGSVLTIVLVSAIDVLDAYLSDDETKKKDLPYTIGVDVVKTLVGSVAGAAVSAGFVFAAGLMGITMVGALPVVLAIGAAIGIGMILDHYVDTKKVAHLLHGWFDRQLEKARHFLVQAGHVVTETAHVWLEIAKDGASTVRHLYQKAEWEILQAVNPYRIFGHPLY